MIARGLALGALIAFVAVAPALGLEVEGSKLTLNPVEMEACRTEGGCMLLTADFVRSILTQERAKACPRNGKVT